MTAFNFPVGYHPFHAVKIINFQLNRWHSLGYARFVDLLQAAHSAPGHWMTGKEL